ncbi:MULTISPECIES: hypothetical protein [Methylobacteriaceae]|uniref:hypothetical protein n=1 Tax=Methylobacteriaceae TaxID=119045 RepID=UPI00116AE58A|nr:MULTISPECIES: hypothetical protein [Methylobacteriaceae]GEL42911.1 hypothetical protein MEX01_35020 [Methylorubrum extorquens]
MPLSERVDVYRHLRLRVRCWSVRVNGRVVDHVEAIALRDVRLVIRPGALARVRARQIREVCAHARGTVTDAPRPEGARRLRFCPYAGTTFTADGEPMTAAAAAWFEADGSAWCTLEN